MTMTATLRFAFLVLMTLVLCMADTAQSAITRHSDPNPAEFVKSSCRATRYPVLCAQSLLAYASVIRLSDRQLAMTALSVSISRTRSSASFVKNMSRTVGMKPREWRAVQDCVENMGDSVDRLRQSLRELGRTGAAVGEDFVWHMSNVQTWVSAALTDDDTCLDGFAGSAMNGNVKAAIKDRVVRVAQVTSNALALVNRFASRHPTQTP
ncbi:21 kDa protein [Spatholobus suberectus]|nr:21 kDa protein [Spatholobus suberectus]